MLTRHNIYRGPDALENIDWSTPVATLEAGQGVLAFAQDLEYGRRYICAARAASGSVEEAGLAAVAIVELDEQGRLLPAPLAAPRQLSAQLCRGTLIVGFECPRPAGFAVAETFELCTDGGAGTIDLDHPVASVPAEPARRSAQFRLPAPPTPLLVAVRAAAGARRGPLGPVLRVEGPPPTAPAVAL